MATSAAFHRESRRAGVGPAEAHKRRRAPGHVRNKCPKWVRGRAAPRSGIVALWALASFCPVVLRARASFRYCQRRGRERSGSGPGCVPKDPLGQGHTRAVGLSPTGNRLINNFLGEDYWPGLHGSGREDIEPGAGMTLSEWITSTDPYTRPPTTLSLVGGQEVPAIHLRTSDPPPSGGGAACGAGNL